MQPLLDSVGQRAGVVEDRLPGLERLNRLYETLSRINQALIRERDRQSLLNRVCELLVAQGAFDVAWIGWWSPEEQRLVPVARSGNATLSHSSAAFPIHPAGQVPGTLTVGSNEPGVLQDKEVALLKQATLDISFALDHLVNRDERLHAEAVAQHEKLFSDAMIESMPGIVYFYTEAGRFLRWNRNFVAVSGCSPQQIAQRHPLDFFAGHDKRRVAERIQEVFREGESSVEADFVSQDGRVTPYHFTGRRVMFKGSACLVGVGVDITERRRSEVALKEYAARLQSVSRKLIEVQESERRTLARELHDTVGQELTALSLNLIMVRAAIPPEIVTVVGQRLEDSEALLQETTQHVRHVMIELRPAGIDELGLLAALKEHGLRVARRGGLSIVVRGAEPKPRLPSTVEIALFRIAQEALNNTVKHAQASDVSIELSVEPGSLVLTVEDNGKGFDAGPERSTGLYGMGMTTMRERAELIGSSLKVDSEVGRGTRVTVRTPTGDA